MSAPKNGWTCWGSVRGSCGHVHRTYEAALRCCEADHQAVRRTYGRNHYSDRVVYQVIDGRRDREEYIPPEIREAEERAIREIEEARKREEAEDRAKYLRTRKRILGIFDELIDVYDALGDDDMAEDTRACRANAERLWTDDLRARDSLAAVGLLKEES